MVPLVQLELLLSFATTGREKAKPNRSGQSNGGKETKVSGNPRDSRRPGTNNAEFPTSLRSRHE